MQLPPTHPRRRQTLPAKTPTNRELSAVQMKATVLGRCHLHLVVLVYDTGNDDARAELQTCFL
jgi:hypothetical protein